MGKSTAASMMKTMNIPVFDADKAVHGLMGPRGQALPALAHRFPKAVGPDGVDRQMLGELVFEDAVALADLERILHPMVRALRQSFLLSHALRRTRYVVMDVPLLFETGGDKSCDAILVVTAPSFLQRQRVLSRSGMTVKKFTGILKRQFQDSDKQRRATSVITSGLGKRETWVRLRRALRRDFLFVEKKSCG
ncbi:MAG: dephospho-CoA kinase [Alphaproteobacteria bacterium]|nr:dephospho-CoA kinase [Alphaproteobacteria bacterium]